MRCELYSSLNELNALRDSLERIQGYLEIEQEAKPTADGVPPASWPTSGDLHVEKLSARYSRVSAAGGASLPIVYAVIHRRMDQEYCMTYPSRYRLANELVLVSEEIFLLRPLIYQSRIVGRTGSGKVLVLSQRERINH